MNKFNVCSKIEGLLFTCTALSVDTFITQFIRLGYTNFSIVCDDAVFFSNDYIVLVK